MPGCFLGGQVLSAGSWDALHGPLSPTAPPATAHPRLSPAVQAAFSALQHRPCARGPSPCPVLLLTPPVTVLAKLPTPEKQVRMAPSAMARLRQELVEGVGAFPGAVDAVVDAFQVGNTPSGVCRVQPVLTLTCPHLPCALPLPHVNRRLLLPHPLLTLDYPAWRISRDAHTPHFVCFAITG